MAPPPRARSAGTAARATRIGAADVHAEHLVPGRRVGRLDRPVALHAGRVDDDVETAVALDGACHERLAVAVVAHVALEAVDAQLAHRLLDAGVRADHHRGALAREPRRCGAPDAERAADHERDLAVEARAHGTSGGSFTETKRGR